jgi:hypothetical protein
LRKDKHLASIFTIFVSIIFPFEYHGIQQFLVTGGISMPKYDIDINGTPTCDKTATDKKAAHFFMSANTPAGFVSHFENLYDAAGDWRAYILKGTPGIVGSFLDKAGRRFEDAGIDIQYIHCVSNPDAVSAIVLPKLKICIADGMPPHCIKPKFPGIVECEIMMFYPDSEKLLQQRNKILQFSARAQALYDRAYRYLSAAVSLQNDTFRIAAEFFDAEGLEKYVAGLGKRLLPPKGRAGANTLRFLSGITANGIVSFYDTVESSYDRVFAIEDGYGVGRFLISALCEKATAAGYDVISCNCPLSQSPEHLLIPSLSIAFITSNSFHRAEGKACRHINIKRFMDCDSLRLKKARIGFNRRASRELLDQTVSLLSEAKADDDIVRSCYEPCVDHSAAQSKIDALVTEIIDNAAAQ